MGLMVSQYTVDNYYAVSNLVRQQMGKTTPYSIALLIVALKNGFNDMFSFIDWLESGYGVLVDE